MRRLLVIAVLALIVGGIWWGLQLLAPDDTAPAPSDSSPSISAPSTPEPVAPEAASAPSPSHPDDVDVADSPDDQDEVLEHDHDSQGQDDHRHGDPVDPTSPAKARDKEQAATFKQYERIATTFVETYARPRGQTSQEQWWAQVSVLLSDDAREIYAGTDPRNVPFTKVTGRAAVVPSDAPMHLLTIVRVPTDAGGYLVEMRTGPEGILVARLTLEEGNQ